MYNQKMLTIHSHSFFQGTSDITNSINANIGSQEFDYGTILLHSHLIITDA